MAQDDPGKRAKWSNYVNDQLERLGITAAELSHQTGILNKTIYNWTSGAAGVSAEPCLTLAAAFHVPASEVLDAAGYPILARAMEGREPDPEGEPADRIVRLILERQDLDQGQQADLIAHYERRIQRVGAEIDSIINAMRSPDVETNSA